MRIRHIGLHYMLPLIIVLLSCDKPGEQGITYDFGKKPTTEDSQTPQDTQDPQDPGGQEEPQNPGSPETPDTPETPVPTAGKVVVGYVTSWGKSLPDPTYLTHINYAFGKVKSDFKSLEIENTSRLNKIVALKKTHPQLKVVLSIGGWGATHFSEMAADDANRKAFCQSCLAAVRSYGLDGIDIDWEYPGTPTSENISYSANDDKNFTKLIKDLRATLGADRIVSMASSSSARYVIFRDFIDYMDWVNLMTYDMGDPPEHHNAPLYKSSRTYRSCDEAVALHLAAGVPYDKMVMGMAFYGRDDNHTFTSGDDDNFIYYRDISTAGYKECWDNDAKVPYLTNASGTMVLSYDNEASIGLKAEYVIQKDLKGAMYWAVEGDDDNWTLSRAISARLLGTGGTDNPGADEVPTYAVTNAYVQAYMDGVRYTDWDFSSTQVFNYAGGGPGNGADIPPSVTIKWDASAAQGSQTLRLWDSDWSREYSLGSGVSSQAVSNLVPDSHYYYQVTDSKDQIVGKGEFKTTGALHQVFFENNVHNGRDLGGLKTLDGKTLRYRLLYRGGRVDGEYMNSAGKTEAAAVGIKAELDLRESKAVPKSSYFGSGVAFCAPGFEESENYRTMLKDRSERVKECFEFIVQCLRSNKPVYFHCAAGRDRTGTIAALCLGVLGVREGDVARDYELTYFAPDEWSMSTNKETGQRFYDHTRNVGSYERMVKYLRDQDKSTTKTLKGGSEQYLLNIGVSRTDIDDFRSIMLR